MAIEDKEIKQGEHEIFSEESNKVYYTLYITIYYKV